MSDDIQPVPREGQDPTLDLNLEQWLERIQRQHPVEIDMGLHRVGEVGRRLGLAFTSLVITVGGTNGKGSCVAMLDSVLRSAGYRSGTYTSPHILAYNERVCLQGKPVSDELLCDAFSQIAQAQQEISLSYFEYGTLAALVILQQAELDIVILEVGLGGRLDAVNIIDPDVAVISSIDLDHQEWLGDTRELIGREKAGIFRTGVPAVCGEPDLPQSIRDHAMALQAPLYQQGVDYAVTNIAAAHWDWRGRGANGEVQLRNLPHPGLDLVNAATVLQVLHLLPEPPPEQAIRSGLRHTYLPGRFQCLQDARGGPALIVDVAHNPHAARELARKLQALKASQPMPVRIHLLLAMMRDKDQAGFFAALENTVDIWYIAHFPQPRCLESDELLKLLQEASRQLPQDDSRRATAPNRFRGPFPDIEQAYEGARAEIAGIVESAESTESTESTESAESADGSADIIVATGSFFTVAGIMQLTRVQACASASERQD